MCLICVFLTGTHMSSLQPEMELSANCHHGPLTGLSVGALTAVCILYPSQSHLGSPVLRRDRDRNSVSQAVTLAQTRRKRRYHHSCSVNQSPSARRCFMNQRQSHNYTISWRSSSARKEIWHLVQEQRKSHSLLFSWFCNCLKARGP